jgi:Rha family phage regulatory protein
MGQLIRFELPQDAVFLRDGHSTTTSRTVAEVFGKRHRDVIRAIRELDCPTDFAERNFAPGFYMDANNQARPMYTMAKDGFTFLVMGFTGREAAQRKVAYIEAFNAMEAALRRDFSHYSEPPRRTVELDEADFWKMKAELAELKLFKAEALTAPKRRAADAQEEHRIISLHRAGHGPTAIGKEVGRTASGIDSILKRLRRQGRL